MADSEMVQALPRKPCFRGVDSYSWSLPVMYVNFHLTLGFESWGSPKELPMEEMVWKGQSMRQQKSRQKEHQLLWIRPPTAGWGGRGLQAAGGAVSWEPGCPLIYFPSCTTPAEGNRQRATNLATYALWVECTTYGELTDSRGPGDHTSLWSWCG